MLLRRSLSVIAVMLVALLLLLAACAEETTTTTTTPTTTPTTTATTTPTTTAAGQYGGVLKLVPIALPSNIGWPADTLGSGAMCNAPALEALAFKEWGGKHYQPRLATSWELAPDRSYLTINLRQGVKFHDGTDFNAEAVKWNLEQWVENGKRNDWASIEVIDDYTVRVNSNKAYQNTFIDNIIDGRETMISPAAVEKNGVDWARDNPVGTGAFKMVSFERDVSIVYTSNDDYWQEGLPYFDSIEIVIIVEPTTSSLSLQTGEVDILHTSGLKVVHDLIELGFDYVRTPTNAMAFYPDGVNPDSPFYDKRVREAVEYAIDKEALVAATGYGFQEATYQFAMPGTVGYDPDFVGRLYDPDKARQLLEDAGYPNGFETSIYGAPGTYSVDEMLIMQQYLAEVGIDAKVDLISQAVYREKLFGGWHNALFGWFGPNVMEGNNLVQWKDYLGANRIFCPSATVPEGFQAILDEALATTEPDDALIRNVNRAIFDNASVIPIHYIQDFVVMRKGIHDHGFYTGNSYMLWTPETLWMEQ